MTQKKADRFERMVEDAALINGEDRFLDAATIVKLLRKEHRAVVRMIQMMPRVAYLASDSLLRTDVLSKLTKRAT